MKINVNDIRVGNILEIDGRLWVVAKTMHTQPGKGGAYMQVEMKDIKEGIKKNERFRSSETVTKVHLEAKEFQYLYTSGDDIEVMDKSSFEQISLNKDLFGDQLEFLQEGMDISIEFHNDTPIAVVLPETLVLEVEECEPVVKGQTAASSYKPAKLVNGVRIMVPPFIKIGDKIEVRVASLEYLQRAE
jgi:elongation factor P